MGISGKYNFPGIKKYGAKGLMMALGSVSWFAPFMKFPIVGIIVDAAFQLFTNWMANNGLVVLNIGASIVEGEFDQSAFDKGLDKALSEVEAQHGKPLTPEQQKRIDDAVIEIFRKFAPLSGA